MLTGTIHKKAADWVARVIQICQPDAVHWCDGSEDEHKKLCEILVNKGIYTKLSEDKRKNSYLARVPEEDLQRLDDRTYICSEKEEDAGKYKHWADPTETKNKLARLFYGCMAGRTMYIVPFCLGPLDSPVAKYGLQITDSEYVVTNMHYMPSTGASVLKRMEDELFGGGNYLRKGYCNFISCLHSLGCPLKPGQEDVKWPHNTDNKLICFFPDDDEIISYGSGYAENSILSKKYLSLHVCTNAARKEGWLAENMMLYGVTTPKGGRTYIAQAYPAKASLGSKMDSIVPTDELKKKGYRVNLISNDITWMYVHEDDTVRAVNPEQSLFVTVKETNENALKAARSNTIFTNVGLTDEGDVWWEGLTEEAPAHAIDWQGKDWTPESGTKCAHDHGSFVAPIRQCPLFEYNEMMMDIEQNDPVVGAIVFGNLRSKTIPLVYQAHGWQHGVYLGLSMTSETEDSDGKLTIDADPMGIRTYLGYDFGEYVEHWLSMLEAVDEDRLPKVFMVNWNRKNTSGNKYWSGGGNNIRIFDWIQRRVQNKVTGVENALGTIPAYSELDLEELPEYTEDTYNKNMAINVSEWKSELKTQEVLFKAIGDRLPAAMEEERQALLARISG